MINKIFPRKLDTSTDLKLTSKDSMVDALNVSISDSTYTGEEGSGDIGVQKNMLGNEAAIPYNSFDAIMGGVNYQVIGSVTDIKTRIVYFFVWANSLEKQGIYAYDPLGRLPKSKTEPQGKKGSVRLILNSSLFRFPQNGFVKADIVHVKRSEFSNYQVIKDYMVNGGFWDEMSADAIIYFTDDNSEPKKINAYRALLDNSSQSNVDNVYGISNYTIQETNDFISACPRTPLEKISFEFAFDPLFNGSNFLGGSCFTFAYQFVYKDGIESSISSYSDLAVPMQTLSQGSSSFVDYTTTNVCLLKIPASNREVEYIRILSRTHDEHSWLLVDEVKPSELFSGNIYKFYNNKLLTGISNELVTKQFDAVPKTAYTQTVSNNRLIYGNYTDGFDNVSVSATITPIVSDLPQVSDVNVYITPSIRSKGKWTEGMTASQKQARNKIFNGGASFIIDVDATDLVLPSNSIVRFNLKVSPDKNFHIYRKNGWSMPSADSTTAQNYFENDGLANQYPTSYDKSDSYATEDSEQQVNHVISGTWTSYGPNGNQQNQTVYIGRDVTRPLIIPGGQLAFYIEFKYIGASLFGSDAAKKISSTISKLLCNGVVADNSVVVLSSQHQHVHSWDLGISNFANISSFGPRNNNGSLYGPGVYTGDGMDVNFIDNPYPSSDYRSWLITPVFKGIFNSAVPQGPVGYVIANSGSTKFGFEYVSEANEGSINEILLNIKSIDTINFVSCIRRPVVYGNWTVLENSFILSNNSFEQKQQDFIDHIDVLTIQTISKYYGLQPDDYEEFWELNLTGETLSGYENYKRQFGGISNVQISLNQGNPFDATFPNSTKIGLCVIDGEGGIGGRQSWSRRANAYKINNGGSILCWNYRSFITVEGLAIGSQQRRIDGYFFNGLDTISGLNYFTENSNFIGIDSGQSAALIGSIIYSGEDITDSYPCDFSCIPLRKFPDGSNENSPYSTIPDQNAKAIQPKIEVTNKLIDVSITGEQNSFRSFKSNSYHEFGIVYYDERGRHGFVNPLQPVYAPGYSDLDRGEFGNGKGKIDFRISVTSPHPSWAKYYKIVHSRSTSVQRFVQYTTGGAFIRHSPPENEPSADNIYVSLNYLQSSVLSYSKAFGARDENGSLDIYKFSPGDRVRIINYEETDSVRVYPHAYDFEVINLVDLGLENNPLSETSSNVPYNQTGHFLILKNNPSAIAFDYSSVKGGIDKWKNNCVIEIYTPLKVSDESFRVFYEVSDPIFTAGLQQFINVRNGDVWFRPIAMNIRNDENGIWPDLLIDAPDNISENTSRPNFRSRYVESMTFTDLHKGNSYGLGRPNVIYKESKEIKNESGLIYSMPTAQSALRLKYSDFNASTLNFKDVPEVYGAINYLIDRGDSVLCIQDSKCSIIPVYRNIISDSSGTELITSSTNVLGSERYYAGQIGCDGAPESVVDVDGVVYFVNKSTGKVFSVSGSTSEEISSIGMESYFRTVFSNSSGNIRVPAGYDPVNKEYVFTIKDYSEGEDVFEPPPPAISGCMDPASCNYNPEATVSDSSCIYPAPHRDCLGQCVNDSDGDGICDEEEINGCLDPTALNYNPNATENAPETCIYLGCMDATACNYNPLANLNDGSCVYPPQYRDCNGNCTEYWTLYSSDMAEGSDITGVCKDTQIAFLCNDPSACNYVEYTDENIPSNHFYSSVAVYDENGNMLFGGCEYQSCLPPPPPPDEPPSDTILIDTIDKYVEHVGINHMDIAYLVTYANSRELFNTSVFFDYEDNGAVGTGDMLVFLSLFGTQLLPEYNEAESEGFIYYNSYIIPPISNSQQITFIQDTGFNLPSSANYNPLLGGEDLIRYRAIKLLHIIAASQTTKIDLKDLLVSWSQIDGYAHTAIHRGFNSPINSDSYLTGNTISFGSSMLTEFLTQYGISDYENPDINPEELVFTS